MQIFRKMIHRLWYPQPDDPQMFLFSLVSILPFMTAAAMLDHDTCRAAVLALVIGVLLCFAVSKIREALLCEINCLFLRKYGRINWYKIFLRALCGICLPVLILPFLRLSGPLLYNILSAALLLPVILMIPAIAIHKFFFILSVVYGLGGSGQILLNVDRPWIILVSVFSLASLPPVIAEAIKMRRYLSCPLDAAS